MSAKTFMIAASVAGASAMAAPRIELDLSAMSESAVVSKANLQSSNIYTNLIKTHTTSAYTTGHHAGSTTATYDAQGKASGSKNIGSRQDWTEQCPADTATPANCPFPVARAYDHNDETVAVHTNVYLIDFDGKDTFEGNQLPAKVKSSDVFGLAALKNQRATYLFKYDAVDTAGNRAEQVVFALILNDLKAPVISSCYNSKKVVVEAAAQTSGGAFQFFCGTVIKRSLPPVEGSDKRESVSSPAASSPMASSATYQAIDNIDGNLDKSIRFKLYQVNGAHSGVIGANDAASHSGLTQGAAKNAMSTRLTAAQAPTGARWIVEAYVNDAAGYYGSNGADNKSSDFLDVKIVDTTAPRIQLEGQNTAYGECCRAGATACATQTHVGYREGRSLAFDANDGDISANVVSTGAFTVKGTQFVSDAKACTADKFGKCYTVDLTKTATKKVYHRAQDAAGNTAVRFQGGHNTFYAMRTVEVVDRNAPKVALKGVDTVTLKSTRKNGNNAQAYISGLDLGVTRTDTCVEEANLSLDIQWKGKSPGDLTDLGTFTRTYKVCDRVKGGSDAAACDGKKSWATAQHCCANGDIPAKAIPCCDTVERTFEVIDDEAPEIEVMGDKKLIIDASTVQEYTDAGATCNDYVDGVLSHAVEVSGEVVNMRRPGTYTIRYDCVDLSGKEALPEFRKVQVVDRTCPQVKLNGAKVNYVEAGFPYLDAGFVATDDLDGVISGKGNFVEGKKAGCRTDGDTVNTSQAFYDRRSCKDIKANCGKDQSCTTGEYYISAYNKATNQYVRVLVWCNMAGNGKTYYPVMDAKKAAVPGSMNNGANDCQALGMDMAVFQNVAEKTDAVGKFCKDKENCVFFPVASQPQRQYLCSTNDEGTKSHVHLQTGAVSPGAKAGHSAEVGTYHIKFMCRDRAGNKDCDWKKGAAQTRTVYVKDTLPPVITLHLRNQLIARGSGAQVGLNGMKNPAGSAVGNPNIPAGKLMAEETSSSSVNGWVMGAVASAVSGLALLGYSLRRNTASVVSVPV